MQNKTKMTISFLCILQAFFFSTPPSHAKKKEIKLECVVAKIYIENFIKYQNSSFPVVVSNVFPDSRGWEIDDFRGLHWGSAVPSLNISKLYVRSIPEGAVQNCENVRSYLLSKNISYGPIATAKAQAVKSENIQQNMVIGFSLPVLDGKHTEALVQWFRYTNGGVESRSAGTDYLRVDDDGHWRVQGRIRE